MLAERWITLLGMVDRVAVKASKQVRPVAPLWASQAERAAVIGSSTD